MLGISSALARGRPLPADYAFLLDTISNAEEISAGNSPETLAVRALDDSPCGLTSPSPFFLNCIRQDVLLRTRHIIRAGKSWTEPRRLVSSGAFRLKDRRPGDRLVL
jgi:oligopeptide transport system substrate-binding protein